MDPYSVRKNLFGKEITITLFDIDPVFAEMMAQKAYQEGLRLSKIFNFYDEKSELTLLNRKKDLKASKELSYLIKKAARISKLTKGEYDITLGNCIMRRKKGEKNITPTCSYEDIEIRGDNIILKKPEMMIDLGSVAKGYITDKMVDCLKKNGVKSGLIDSRGDIVVFGKHTQKIGIQHPRDKNKILGHVYLKNSSIATSGDYNQYNGNYDECHIINKKESISITVIAKKLADADLFATAMFVTNEEMRERLLNDKNNIKALSINKSLDLKYYNGFDKIIGLGIKI